MCEGGCPPRNDAFHLPPITATNATLLGLFELLWQPSGGNLIGSLVKMR